MKTNPFLLFLLLFHAFGWLTAGAAERPNVILIMVDDMGFSDLGYHGGEIDTPNLDALAKGGVRFSQFYNSGRCCPTRATLMTGLHPHEVGIGHMTQPPNSNRGKDRPPAYQGYLNRQCVTIAEALEGHDYATLMAGKWHLGNNARDRWPLQRGFEKYFGCISGATRFFHPVSPRDMTLGNEQLTDPKSTTDEAFYTTDAFTDYAIRFLEEEQAGKKKRPSFLYLAYTAPHWPVQAFEDDVAKYRGKYKIGWDKLRQQRLKRQIASGLIRADWPLSPRTPGIPAWDSLSEKKQDEMDLKMSVYAAMIDRVDQNIGKLVAHLKEAKTFDNTLIFFLADNGGCQEGGMFGRGNFYDVEKRNQEHSNSYGEAWANASNTPFRLYKHFVHEGGAATPFFMHWPKGIKSRKEWYGQPAQLIDVMPTILDVAGADYPKTYKGNDILPNDGISLRPAFGGKPLDRKSPIFVEHENNAFARDGKWKLVGRGVSAASGVVPSKWELYDIEMDRTETKNLAASHPDKAKDLAEQWNAWAKRAKVYPKNNKATPAPVSTAQPVANPPQVTGRPFTVTAEVEHRKPKGVVISHGGLMFGYSLHFVNGRPAFSMRNDGKLIELIAKVPVKGRVTVSASLDGNSLTITANGKEVARRKSPGLFVSQPAIGMYLGEDFEDPVGKYKVPNKFNGKILNHKVDVVTTKVGMRTEWGEKVTAENVWQEYPRPAMKRNNWTNLNGHWDYAVTKKDVAKPPAKWAGKILVPFAIEAPLSGVEKRFSPNEALWYHRSIEVEPNKGMRCLLNFEAVDYRSTLWVNGQEIGSHVGGNLPFSYEVTDALKKGSNELILRVTDSTDAKGTYQLHGKQRLNPKGIWYTPVSGIWQTVWLEEVPKVHLTSVHLTPKRDGTVKIKLGVNGKSNAKATVTASLKGKQVAKVEGSADDLTLKIPNPKLWSPDSPTLYDLEIKVGDDVTQSYVGLREVGRERGKYGHWRLTLNGKPIFHLGTLDQGWWPDGLLTPPSDAALLSDVEFLKAAGFNVIRKHIKVEPRRFYTHCDRIGMMVWQDQVSSMSDNPKWTRLKPKPERRVWPKTAHAQFVSELKEMMDLLHSHPCIVQWVPFNESWGQHQTIEVGKWTVEHDPTRMVNVASGGNFLPAGHIVDHHQYPHPGFPFDLGKGGRFKDYVKVVGEFGGHGFPVKGHLWNPRTRNWGYGGLPKNKEEWLQRYKESIRLLTELRKKGIAAGIYTQTTDVEGEINGLITYDRKVQKLAPEQLRKIHQAAGLSK